MAEEVVFNVRKIAKALDDLEPGLKKQMVREFKTIAKPMAQGISNEIKSISPLSGFTSGDGRFNWEHGVYKRTTISPDNTLIRYRQNRSRRAKITSLVSIWVRNPMAALIGSAGKGSGVPRRAVTKEYSWSGQTRKHRLNGQGQALIGQVRSRGWFNYFYRVSEKQLPNVEREVKLVWEKYSSKVSKGL